MTLASVCIRFKTWMSQFPGPGHVGLTEGEQDPDRRHRADRIDGVSTRITFIAMMFTNVHSWDLVRVRSPLVG